MCTGYAGLDQAVAQVLDVEPAWVADPAPGAAAILAHHMPDVPNLGDITTVQWEDAVHVDILAAGYPCQPFSFAGPRKGTTDSRHIWPHIATAVRHLAPGLVVLENVPGHRNLGFDQVLGDLAALGFDAEWTSLRASDVGAPHKRERLVILARHPDRMAWPPPLAPDRRPRPMAEPRPIQRAVRPARALAELTWDDFEPALDRWAAVIGRPAPAPRVRGRDGDELNPAFAEWLMGLPAGWVTAVPGLTTEQQLTAIGNGVVPQQLAAGIAHLLDRMDVAA
jgi:DNA (cytosine-5)-methyltransferase 1